VTDDMQRWDFFIAHAGPDAAVASELADALERRHGATSFLDAKDLMPGDQWQTKLKQTLSRSRVIVVLISLHSDGAFYQKEEVAIAIDLVRNNTPSYRIVPVLLPGATRQHLIYGLNGLHALTVGDAGLAAVSDALARLLSSARQRAGTEALPHAATLLDQWWSQAEGAYTNAELEATRQFKHQYAAEGGEMVARSHGIEQQRITRAELEKRLTPDQLDYIRVLEKSMEINLVLWRRSYPNRVLNPSERQQADAATDAMAEDLLGVLDSIEEAGFYLDDHYIEVRKVVKQHLTKTPPSHPA
jgi:hypothetical protein